jgi:hypothetical protein
MSDRAWYTVVEKAALVRVAVGTSAIFAPLALE